LVLLISYLIYFYHLHFDTSFGLLSVRGREKNLHDRFCTATRISSVLKPKHPRFTAEAWRWWLSELLPLVHGKRPFGMIRPFDKLRGIQLITSRSGTAPLENQELRQLLVFKKNISLRRGGLSVRGKVKNKRITHPTSIA
jgi:hypothetical protein